MFHKQKGYIALLTVLIVMAVVIVSATTVAFLSIGEGQSGFALFKGEDTLTFAEGCTEDALLKARANASFGDPVGSEVTIVHEGSSCKIKVISKDASPTFTWIMRIQTDITTTKYNRIIEVVFNRTPTVITLTSWKEVTTF